MNKEVKNNDLKSYINVIRRTVISNSFLLQYFLKIVVIYLLSHNVTTWIAVSIPVVLEFSKMLSRGFKKIMNIAVKINYKKYYLIYILISTILFFIISQSHSIYIIYFLTIILGFLSGINNSCITKIDTSNKEYEPYCLMEEERSSVIGATLGLIVSQILYDIHPNLYIIGFIIFGLSIFIINLTIPNMDETNDVMESIDDTEELSIDEKKNIIIVSTLYALITGAWCIGINAYYELIPLISTKTGYLSAIFTFVEIIALFIINAKIIEKINKKGKLLFCEIICSLCDIFYLLIVSLFHNEISIVVTMFLCGITSTIGDPIWGTIMSSYSQNNRRKYVLVNNVYFFVRAISAFCSIFICRYFVIKGIYSFKYLSFILIALIVLFYIIANKINKKIFGKTI